MRDLMVPGWGHTSLTFGTLSTVLKIGYLSEERYQCNKRNICANSKKGDSPYIADNGGPLHSLEGLTMVEGLFLDIRAETETNKNVKIGNIIFSRLSFYKEWIIEKNGENFCTKDRALRIESKRKREFFDDQKGKKKLKT